MCSRFEPVRLIKVETNSYSNVAKNSASVSGRIIDEGEGDNISFGFCLDSIENPTLEDGMVVPETSKNSLGEFTSDVTGLACETRYYVRAFIRNSAKTSYGTQLSFTTVSCDANLPEADFTASSTNITEGQSVQFTDQSTSDPTSWSWNFGDGSTSTEQNPSHIYLSAGIYSVSLTAANSYGSDTETKTNYITVIVVVNPPVTDFTASSTDITEGQSVQFTDLSTNTPTSWSWNFGDDNTSTEQNPSHIYATAGTYTVSLTASNNFGSDAETKADYITVSVVVNPPVVEFTASSTKITEGQSVQFTDQSTNTPTSWSWDFGDGSTSTEQNPSHTYTSAGTYTVSLTAANSIGSDTETKSGYITVSAVGNPPVVLFTASSTDITEGQSVQFTDQSTNTPTSWSWDFGDGSTSTEQNPSHTYTSAGTYTVSLTAANSFGSNTETKTDYITVVAEGDQPVADFSASTRNIEEGQSVQFTDQSTNSPTSWSWNFGDGQTSTSQNPSHTYNSAGTFTVSLTAANSFGSDTETKTNHITVTASNTVEDIDKNVYQTVQIGEQLWMAENLKTTRYGDGSAIPLVEGTAEWGALTFTNKAYCWYFNSTANRDTYGGLYNWAAAMNGAASSDANPSGVQGVCPDGWHLPSDSEWKELEMYLGMSQADADNMLWRGKDEGGKLKETGISHWNSPNEGATNESGFSALPGGIRGYAGSFINEGSYADFWSATENGASVAWYRMLNYDHADVNRQGDYGKNGGFSVRCVKD